MSKVEALTRRECALYQLGAYEMILATNKQTDISSEIMVGLIMEFMQAYMPEYSIEDIKTLVRLCYKEKESGTARKLFDKRNKEFLGGGKFK